MSIITTNIHTTANAGRAVSLLFDSRDQLIKLVDSFLQHGYIESQGPIGLVEVDEESDPAVFQDLAALFVKGGKVAGKVAFFGDVELSGDVIRSKLDSYAAGLGAATHTVVYGNRRAAALAFCMAVLDREVDYPSTVVEAEESATASVEENVAKLLGKNMSAADKWAATKALIDNGNASREADLPFTRGTNQQMWRLHLLVDKFPALGERINDTALSLPNKEVIAKALKVDTLEEAKALLSTEKPVPAIPKGVIREYASRLTYGDDDLSSLLEGIASGSTADFEAGLKSLAVRLGLRTE